MKGFELVNGDVSIVDNQIQIIEGNDLIRQTVESILGTNKGEWFLNIDEGIEFRTMLAKAPEIEDIRNQIIQGLQQVDSTFNLDDFTCEVENRKMTITFTATNSTGEVIEGVQEY